MSDSKKKAEIISFVLRHYPDLNSAENIEKMLSDQWQQRTDGSASGEYSMFDVLNISGFDLTELSDVDLMGIDFHTLLSGCEWNYYSESVIQYMGDRPFQLP